MTVKLTSLPLKGLFSELIKISKGPLKQAVLSCVTDEAANKRVRYADSICKVKTIWQIDKNVDVDDFYYPTTINFDNSSKVISCIEELFKGQRALIVEGIAGQGKSIFLRYLTKKALFHSNIIPIFVQLRFISKDNDIESLVLKALNSVGIINDPLVIEYFLRSGKLYLVLDGFDEIEDEYRSETIRIIEEYLHNYEKLKVLISSRPNSDIQHSYMFSVIRIRPLDASNRKKLISVLVSNAEIRQDIIKSITNKPKISGVLVTPLLITLLVITYKSENEIPDHLSDFYKALFTTLIKRHDKTKPGYVRQRLTSIGNVKFERLFENICFTALKSYKISMSENEYFQFTQEAMSVEKIEGVCAESLMQDITSVTCLILLDGDKYYFLHKSIPEYFSAQRIAQEQDPTIKSLIYKQLRNNLIPENWYQTIRFLDEIDNYDFNTKLLFPYCEDVFGAKVLSTTNSLPKFTKTSFLKLIGNASEVKVSKYGDGVKAEFTLGTKNWFTVNYLEAAIKKAISFFLVNRVSDVKLSGIDKLKGKIVPLEYLLDEANLWPSFLSFINASSYLSDVYKSVVSAKTDIQEREKNTLSFMQLNIN